MPDDLSKYRARAKAHQTELDMSVVYLKPKELKARWNCSLGSVYAIPRDLLPYKTIGRGAVKPQRRYHPDDVLAYEAMDRNDDLPGHRKVG